ncbi:MAG: hypothetical protein ACWGQW_04825 [bacterium]
MTKTRAEQLEFIRADDKWPNMVLPLINRSNQGMPMIGVLLEPTPIVFLTNMWEMDTVNCPTKEYPSLEEMLDDGWEVD